MGKGYRVLDLFSGVGAWSLGLERTGGFETVAFCEIQPFQRQVLAKHWPHVECFRDVRSVGTDTVRHLAPNVIAAGFPCQDLSYAGLGAGIRGERSGLWFEVDRLVGELGPDLVLLENVTAILSRGIDVVLGCLAARGYDAWWDCLPASALGYPHERDRWFLVAYPAGLRREQGERAAQEWRRIVRARTLGGLSAQAEAANDHEVRSGFVRIVDGLPDHVERLDALGNAIIPEIPELIGLAILAADEALRAAA